MGTREFWHPALQALSNSRGTGMRAAGQGWQPLWEESTSPERSMTGELRNIQVWADRRRTTWLGTAMCGQRTGRRPTSAEQEGACSSEAGYRQTVHTISLPWTKYLLTTVDPCKKNQRKTNTYTHIAQKNQLYLSCRASQWKLMWDV